MKKLKVGMQAPDFSTTDQDGKLFSLSALKGQKVILYFYPKDDTPTCTKQACNLRDNYNALLKAGFAVYGISIDNENSHQKFRKKYGLPFALLTDTNHSVHKKYGTWVQKTMYGRQYMGTARTTFVIDEAGKIVELIDQVDSANHAGQILGGVVKPKLMATKSKPTSKLAARKTTVKKVFGSKKTA